MSALPAGRCQTKVKPRAEYNTCGEFSSSSSTYTGVPMRRMCELPRMDTPTKSSILGATASGVVKKTKGVQRDIDQRGHPFALGEVKPLNLIQRILEHHHVTHIVDFAAGSAAIAIAAAGGMNYEGMAANAVHRDWLDSTLDECVMFMASQDKNFTKSLGVSDEVTEKVAKYFGGTMMEARRILAPPPEDAKAEDEDPSEEESSEEDESSGA